MDQMTYTEQCNVDTAIEMGKPIEMISPAGKLVKVPTARVQERREAGYIFK